MANSPSPPRSDPAADPMHVMSTTSTSPGGDVTVTTTTTTSTTTVLAGGGGGDVSSVLQTHGVPMEGAPVSGTHLQAHERSLESLMQQLRVQGSPYSPERADGSPHRASLTESLSSLRQALNDVQHLQSGLTETEREKEYQRENDELQKQIESLKAQLAGSEREEMQRETTGLSPRHDRRPTEYPEGEKLTPANYINEMQLGRDEATVEQLSELRGRLCYGALPQDFIKLSHPLAKSCFLMGPDGLHMLLKVAAEGKKEGGNEANMEMLLKIGYDVLTIYDNVRNGRVTELCVFPASSIQNQPATWKGAGTLLELDSKNEKPELFPKAAPYVNKHADYLKTHGSEPFNFVAYQKLEAEWAKGKEEYGIQAKSGRKEYPECGGPPRPGWWKPSPKPRFTDDMPWCGGCMTQEALAALGDNVQPCHVRAFLCHYMGMNPLFGGDGFTLPEGSVRTITVQNASTLPIEWDGDTPKITENGGEKPHDWRKGDMLVRARRPKENNCVITKKEELLQLAATGPLDIVLVGMGTLKEYLATNMYRRDVVGMCSTPIGSPTMEQCVEKIAELLQVLLEEKYFVKDKGTYKKAMHHNWCEKGPDGVNAATGAREVGKKVNLRPETFAAKYMDESGGQYVVEQGERLGGVGFRFRVAGKPQKFTTLANGPAGSRALKIGGPNALQSLPKDCLQCMIRQGYKPIEIYQFLIKGNGFVLDVFPWDLWKPGDEADEKRHFPTTIAGVRAFLERQFPDAVKFLDKFYPCGPDAEKPWSNTDWEIPTEEELKLILPDPANWPRTLTYPGLQKLGDAVTKAQFRQFLSTTCSLGADWKGLPAVHGLDPADRTFGFITINEELKTMREESRVVTIPMGAPAPDQVVQHICNEYKRMREKSVD